MALRSRFARTDGARSFVCAAAGKARARADADRRCDTPPLPAFGARFARFGANPLGGDGRVGMVTDPGAVSGEART